MKMRSKLAALLGAGALVLGVAGLALAATGPSDDGITPTLHSGNITADGNGGSAAADCLAADAVEIGDATADGTSTNGVTVHMTYDGTTKAVSFTVDGGVVTIAYIKGGDAYNMYDYRPDGVTSDGNLFAPDNASEGPAGLSHAVFCTAAGTTTTSTEESSTTTTEESSTTTTEESSTTASTQSGTTTAHTPTLPPTSEFGGTSSGSDNSWMLMAGLGMVLGSLLVLVPARAKSRR